jgi:hypothetical protein
MDSIANVSFRDRCDQPTERARIRAWNTPAE